MRQLLTARLSPVDLVGIILLGAWALWVIASTIAHDFALINALPYLTAPAFTVLGVIAGRHLQSEPIEDWFPAFLLTVSIYMLVSVTVQGGAGGGPLGYANANAALGIQVTVICAITAMHVQGTPRTWALWGTALAASSVLWTLSQAGIALLVPVIITIVLALARPGPRRLWAVPLAGLAVIAAAAAILYIARMPTWPASLERAFSGARRELWTDAISLWAKDFDTGSGPGSFAAFSSIADDADTERVHMSVLQVGSELGLVGVLLVAALILVALARLAGAAPNPRLVGTTALAALLVHSFVDHLLEFPAIMLALGTLIGLSRHSRGRLKSEG